MIFLLAAVMGEMTDAELVAQYKKTGAGSALGELYQRYNHLVFGVCMKYLKHEEESRDALMLIFEKLMEDLKVHEVRNFRSWLHSVTRNHCLMKLRKEKSVRQKEEDWKKSEAEVVEFNPDPHLSDENPKEVQLQALESGIQELKDEQKLCVELFFLKGKSYQEVAELTGFTLKQVKSHLQNGKRNLKNYLLRQTHG